MKFIADAMLGKLAKRLRLLGCDVLYDPDHDDNEIIRLSLEQDRVILTRDTELSLRPLARNNLVIDSDDPDEQLLQVLSAFGLAPGPGSLTRCSVCNTLLSGVNKEAIRDLVPEHVFITHDEFMRCEDCGRIYWKGSHVKLKK